MVLKPQFVMLDEPTSALDMSVQAQVVDLLRDLQAKHNLAYLFISHDLKVVRALANDVIVMRNGKIVEYGPAEQIFERPQTDYTKALISAAFHIETAPSRRRQRIEHRRGTMPEKEKGRILLAVTGFNPQPWYELLSPAREVVTGAGRRQRSVDHLCGGLEAAAEPAGEAAQSARDLLDRRRRRPYLRRSEPARRADRARRRRQSDAAHDRICVLARARPSPAGHALPRAAEEEDLARAAAAAGQRHLGRHHGARRTRPRRGKRAACAAASGSTAGAAPSSRCRMSRPSTATTG